jgi:hypothetical protein
MPQQVCDVSKSGVLTSLESESALYLGLLCLVFLSTSYERLGQGYEQPVEFRTRWSVREQVRWRNKSVM